MLSRARIRLESTTPPLAIVDRYHVRNGRGPLPGCDFRLFRRPAPRGARHAPTSPPAPASRPPTAAPERPSAAAPAARTAPRAIAEAGPWR